MSKVYCATKISNSQIFGKFIKNIFERLYKIVHFGYPMKSLLLDLRTFLERDT